MAATFLKRSHAIVWLPPRSVGERAFATEARLLVIRTSGAAGDARYERCSLDALPKVKSVSLVFDARDVTVLAPTVPALSAAKLARALPNIVEDSLLQDVGACAFAAGPTRPDGTRLVAVVDRGWLEFTVGAFERRGMWVTGAWPAQLVLPIAPAGWSIGCLQHGLAVRTGPCDGFGWAASDDADFRTEALAAAMQAARQIGSSGQEVQAYVEDASWKPSLERACQRESVSLRIAGLPVPTSAPVDLLDGRAGNAGQRWLANVDWRAWRVPAALAAACVVAALAGLNVHWMQLAQQRSQLKASMDRQFRQTFPNAQVVVDPLLQMQRQVSTLRARAGQSGPDDFLPLLARFAQALGPRGVDALAGVEYREGQIRVRFQPSFVESSAAREGIREACQRQGLMLSFDKDTPALASVKVAA